MLKGGESGPAVVPGDPEKSLIIQAIRHVDESLEMPPESLARGDSGRPGRLGRRRGEMAGIRHGGPNNGGGKSTGLSSRCVSSLRRRTRPDRPRGRSIASSRPAAAAMGCDPPRRPTSGP